MQKQEKSNGTTGTASTEAWYGAEPNIPESSITKTLNIDVLICGAGTGGLVAAIFAAKQGAKTLVLEKNSKVGYFKTYVGAVDTKPQKAAGNLAKIDKEEIVQELLHYPSQYDDVDKKLIEKSNPVDEKLIRLWANESGQAVDALAAEMVEYGVKHVAEYDVGEGYHGKFKIFPTHTKLLVPVLKGGPKARVHGGTGVIEPLVLKRAKSYGAEFMFKTPLVKLIKEGNRVTGAIAKSKDGYIRINASKGVLLSTGGYSDDNELFAKRNPQATSVSTMYYGQPGNTGDGHKAGIWAGAEKDCYGTAGCFDRGIVKPGEKAGLPFKRLNALVGPMDAFHMGSQPFMKVNMDGKRFLSESVPYDVILYPLSNEKNGVCNVIWDANYWENIEQFRLVGCCRQIPSQTTPKTYEGISKMINSVLLARGRMTGRIQKANTIEELAKKLKLPVDQFKATVERYNQMAKAGVDEDFGKPAKDLIALETPPFYGATVGAWMMHTTDGLHINTDMQVLDTSGNVIDGLYAAGDVAGGFFGTNYYPELVVGIASGKTITFARHAVLHMTGAI